MPDSDVGSYFGKYFLLKKLAAGGMGEVFLGKQQGPAGFEKILIIKKILPHLTENKEFIELFLGEARLAARMNHRNIVQVFELGEQDGTYFIAMEFVQGKALRDILDRAKEKKEKMPAEICRTIAEQICDGASYAHNLTDQTGRALNLVHRDLNPQNVLISYTGDVKIIDFGIAKSEMSTVKTEAGMIKGKFVYMSPEQSLAKKLDKRSDVFAVGITVYEMLTGINPFHKANIVLCLEAVQRYDPPPPSEYDPVYAPFDPIISKAMAKDRDKRYGDAAEMMDDLRRIVLPRPAERLGQFIQRLFRIEIEAEQKVLQETDSSKLSHAAKPPGRTPARPHAAAARPPTQTQPDPDNDGATAMLSQPASAAMHHTGKQKVPATPARSVPVPRPPAPRAASQPPPTIVQGGGNDKTMIDGESPLNDPALQAAMSKARQQLAPAGPVRPHVEPHHPPPPSPRQRPATRHEEEAPPSTMQLDAETAAAAKRDAIEKSKQRPGHGPQRPSQLQQWLANKKLVLAAGGAGLVAVIAIIFAMVFMLSDGPEKKPLKKAAPKAAVTDTNGDDAAKKAAEDSAARKAADDKAAADRAAADRAAAAEEEERKAKEKAAERKKPKPAPPRVAAAKPALGTLIVNAGGAAVASDAPKQGNRLSLTEKTGTIKVGDDSTPYKVELEYSIEDKEIVFAIKSDPWAIVSVGGPTRGRATPDKPLADVKIGAALTLVELKKPGQPNGMAIRLRYDGK